MILKSIFFFLIFGILWYLLFSFISWDRYWFMDSTFGRIVAVIWFVLLLKNVLKNLD